MFLRLFSGLFLGLFFGFFLFFLGLLLGDVGLLLLGSLLRFFGLLGFGGFLGLGGFGSCLGFFGFGGLASLFGLLSGVGFLLFRGLHGLLLDLLLLQLLDFGLARSGFLRFPGNLLIGLGGRLALGLELVQGSLNDRLGRRQLRRHGKTDEQQGEHQHMQADGPDTGPEVAFRGGWLSLLHQGASVIRPTLPTPAFCNPPMAPMTAP
ncbi:hypothetical protein D3C79_615540 [compost metagenome]